MMGVENVSWRVRRWETRSRNRWYGWRFAAAAAAAGLLVVGE